MDYATVRTVHIGCAVISVSLFVARGAMQAAGIDWRRWAWLRIVPHVNDTVLLGAAIALAVMSTQYPLVHAWLTAKVLALLGYIVLGSVALRRGVSPATRRIAFVAALLSVAYIAGAAVTRSAALGLA
jgi:uncharacterized membrane protein SirB2